MVRANVAADAPSVRFIVRVGLPVAPGRSMPTGIILRVQRERARRNYLESTIFVDWKWEIVVRSFSFDTIASCLAWA